jgi:hypothetical protein
MPPTLPARRRRPFLWLPASLALVAGVLIGLFAAERLPQEPQPTQLAALPTVASTSTLGASPAVTVLDWREMRTSVDAVQLTTVGDRVLATGGQGAWYSDDGGESWEAATIGRSPDQSDWQLGDLAGDNAQLVSIGSAPNSQIGADADRRPVIFESNDRGASWSALSDTSPPSVNGEAAGIVLGGPGFVMIENPVDGARYTHQPQVWTSATGMNWSQTETGAFTDSYVYDLAGRGRLVAVGNAGEGDASAPTAWWSNDGRDWNAVTLAPTGSVSAVTVDVIGFVAVGLGADGSLLLWRSSDGVTWRVVPAPGAAWTRVNDIAASPLGVVISGSGLARSHGAVADFLGRPLLAFLPSNGGAMNIADLEATPGQVVALADRYVALANRCPPDADCATNLGGAVLTGTVSTRQSQTEPACAVTPITSPPETSAEDPRLWMKASAGLWAIVSGQVIDESEQGIKILWISNEEMRGPLSVEVTSVGPPNYRETYRFDGETLSGLDHPSGIAMPPPGCYRFSAQIGTVSGEIVLEVADRRGSKSDK